MFARALIVLLLVLNVGVAAWWALRPKPAPPPPVEPPAGVARLLLLSELPQRKPANEAAATTRSTPASGTAPASRTLRCFTLGPFDADQPGALAAAQDQLRPDVARMQVRETRAGSGNGWHVSMPPFADRAAAQAMAERITTAGFEDYYIVPDGAQANAIELGRYGSQEAARRHQDSLRAAGFRQARAEPVGESRQQHWIDIAVAMDVDAETIRARIAAEQARPLACDAVR